MSLAVLAHPATVRLWTGIYRCWPHFQFATVQQTWPVFLQLHIECGGIRYELVQENLAPHQNYQKSKEKISTKKTNLSLQRKQKNWTYANNYEITLNKAIQYWIHADNYMLMDQIEVLLPPPFHLHQVAIPKFTI